MDLGLFLSPQQLPGVDPGQIVREHLEMVALARDGGFRTVLAAQHFLSAPFQMLQSIPFLARLAAESGGMRVGTGILLLSLLNPVEVAENMATRAAIAPGEVVLGVGMGYREPGDRAFGSERARARTFERKLDVVRRLLAGEAVSAEEPGYRLPVVKEVCVAADDARALERARPYLAGKYDAYVAWGQSEVLPPSDTLRRAFAELTAGGRFIIGSPQTCRAMLAEHGRRLGVGEVLCRVGWPGMPHAEVMDSLRLLAREVLPGLRDAA